MNELTSEIWKDIKGYEGRYQVSNLGRIKSLQRIINAPRGRKRTLPEKILKPTIHRKGYLQIILQKQKEPVKTRRVHRIVLETFYPTNGMENLTVNHKDCDKSNNNLYNLEWVTSEENTAHALKHDRYKKGEECSYSKFKEEDIKWIRMHYIPYDKKFGARAIARKYDVTHDTIWSIVKKHTWKHIQ